MFETKFNRFGMETSYTKKAPWIRMFQKLCFDTIYLISKHNVGIMESKLCFRKQQFEVEEIISLWYGDVRMILEIGLFNFYFLWLNQYITFQTKEYL